MLMFKSVWNGALIAVVVTMLLSIAAIQFSSTDRAGALGGTCDAGTTFISPTAADTLDGVVELGIYIPPILSGATIQQIDHIGFFSNDAFIASGLEGTNGIWIASWDTNLFQNGSSQLKAKIYNAQNNLICTSAAMPITTQNATTPPLANNTSFDLKRVSPLSRNWTGATNVPKTFKVDAVLDNGNGPVKVNGGTLFSWELSAGGVGHISGNDSARQVEYFTGPNAGTAVLVVTAEYAGHIDTVFFNIAVDSVTGTSFPELDEDEIADLLADSVDPDIITEPVETAAQSPVTSEPELTGCLVTVVGVRRYASIINGTDRLTFRELAIADRCFATTRYILPANVAPIEPDRLRAVREDDRVVSINEVDQTKTRRDNRDGILLSGTSLPNTTIVLYIFSEPLVLTTTTDVSGNWSYVLEDPLEPGSHEVFVAVEDSDGEPVRSSAFTFSVAQAAAINANVSGLSLTLDLSNAESNSTIYYMSAVASIMLAGLGLYIYVVRHRGRLNPDEVRADVTAKKS